MSGSSLNVVMGAGVLGLAVARALLDAGQEVRLVSRSGRIANLNGAEGMAADVMDAAAASRACAGAARVYHCAAPPYTKWQSAFPPLQQNILQAAARAGAVLIAAENLYGYGVAGHLTEALPLVASTRKGRVRASLSQRLFDAHARGEVRAVAGRASDFFGPGVRLSAFGERLWPQLLAGKKVNWFGNPDLPHSLTYVPDFAQALITLGQTEAAWGRAWHVPSPEVMTPRQIMLRAATLAKMNQPSIRVTPAWLLSAIGLFVPEAGEMIEMGYSYHQPFIMEDHAFKLAFGAKATAWDDALLATINFWKADASV